MNKALWLLLGLQLRGWLRYLWHSVRTVKGALLVILGLSVFLALFLPAVFFHGKSTVAPEQLRAYGPTALLAYCVLNVLLSGGERAIYFPPAEVVFLFPAPLDRREVLLYKVLFTFLVMLPTTLIMMVFVYAYAPWWLAAYLGLVLGVMFMQLFSMAINLIATTIGATFYSRGRILVGAVVLLVAGVALLRSGALAGVHALPDLMKLLVRSPVWQVITWPLEPFFDVFLATNWSELGQGAVLAIAVDLCMLGVVLVLDVQYLETAAAVSERVYARLQRLRRGGMVDAGRSSGKARFSLPPLPWWGGIGPILWRQLVTAQRGLLRLLIVFSILGAVMVLPMLTNTNEPNDTLPARIVGMLFWLTVFLTTLVPFDFRGDVDRLAVLKTLPIPGWRLAIGQLLTPVLLISAMQGVVLAVAALYAADLTLLAVLAGYVLPVNFFLFGLENLMFLLFPTRVMANSPGDFQAVGRNVLFLMVKVFGLFFVALLAAIPGWIVWLVLQNEVLAFAAGWPVVALAGIALLPPIVFAFRAFDVGRDTPV